MTYHKPMSTPERRQLKRDSVRRRAKGKCHYCTLFVGKAGTLDHVVPKCQGGASAKSNLVWSCRGCNLAKGAMSAEAFAPIAAERRFAVQAARQSERSQKNRAELLASVALRARSQGAS